MKSSILFTAVILLIGISSCMKKSENKLLVTTANGVIEGVHDTTYHVNKYLGIPYAKPPVGDLRWKAPQPVDNWDGVLEAKKFGNGPVQMNVWGDMIYRGDTLSEDCLYLNIWTPETKSETLLPVLVYFYGGGFVAGDGSEPRYDGANMAAKGIVTLTVNYRLNIFGFFAHPELSAEASYKASGNYGLLDQNMALQWVQKNIAAFGGDPKKVTIAGESAGSISVSSQMASPLSKDLIAGAIGESGAAINPTMPPVPLDSAEKIGEEFMEKAGYKSIAELRALTTKEIFDLYKNSKRFGFPTVIDGYFYPKLLPEIFNAGEQAQVPLLVGWNSAEIPGMAFMQGQPYTKENYVAKVKQAYPEDFEEVLNLYPGETPEEVEWSATDLASDRFIAYSTWKWFDLHRKNSQQPTYRYIFSRVRPSVPKPLGAPHASEIEYCMGNLPLIKSFEWTEEDFKVSKDMENYFANFIKTGNPNGDGLPEWKSADANNENPPVMVIDSVSHLINAMNDARYRFLDKAYKNN